MGGVLWDWAINLWNLTPTPGRECQNWIELEDTQFVLENWRMVWQILVNSGHGHACRLTDSWHDSSSWWNTNSRLTPIPALCETDSSFSSQTVHNILRGWAVLPVTGRAAEAQRGCLACLTHGALMNQPLGPSLGHKEKPRPSHLHRMRMSARHAGVESCTLTFPRVRLAK